MTASHRDEAERKLARHQLRSPSTHSNIIPQYSVGKIHIDISIALFANDIINKSNSDKQYSTILAVR